MRLGDPKNNAKRQILRNIEGKTRSDGILMKFLKKKVEFNLS
jgi:hypothetical protein